MRSMPDTPTTRSALAINRELVEKAWKGFMDQQTGWLAIPESEWDEEWERICSDFALRNRKEL